MSRRLDFLTSPLARLMAAVHGVYFFPTGVWPLLDIDSFQLVTGPKYDLWLVRTVGALVAVTGARLSVAAWKRRVSTELVWIAAAQSLVLAMIDLVYVSQKTIPPIYLADALGEALLLAGWALAIWRETRSARETAPALTRAGGSGP